MLEGIAHQEVRGPKKMTQTSTNPRDILDLLKDRIYIPLGVMERHGYTVEELFARRFTPAFREVMREIVDQARELFHAP